MFEKGNKMTGGGVSKQRKFFSLLVTICIVLSTLLIGVNLQLPPSSAASFTHNVGNLKIQSITDWGRILNPIQWPNMGKNQSAQDGLTGFGFIGLVIDQDNYNHVLGSEDIADSFLTYPYNDQEDLRTVNEATMIIDDGTTQKSIASFQNTGAGTGDPNDILINQTAWTVVNKDWAILQWTLNNLKSTPVTGVCIGLELPLSQVGAGLWSGVGGDSGDDTDGFDLANHVYWAQDNNGTGTCIGFGSAIVSDPITHYYSEDYPVDYETEYKFYYENDSWLYNRIHASNSTVGAAPGNRSSTVGWNNLTINAGFSRTLTLVIAINDTRDNMIAALRDAQDYYQNVITGFKITEFSDDQSGVTPQRIEVYNAGRPSTDLVTEGYFLSNDGGTTALPGNWVPNNTIPTYGYRVFEVTGTPVSPEGDIIGLYQNLGGGSIVLVDGLFSYGQEGIIPDPLDGESVARRYDAFTASYTEDWLRNASTGPTWNAQNDVPPANFDSTLVLNEIMFNPTAVEDSFVELYLKDDSLDISGYSLVGDSEYIIPEGTELTSGERFFYLTNTTAQSFFDALDPSGDNVYLYDDNGSLLDMVGWSSSHVPDTTMSRVPNGNGTRDGFDDTSSIAAGWVFDCTPTLRLVEVRAKRNVIFGEPGRELFFKLNITNKQSVNDTFIIYNSTLNGYPVVILDETGTFIISEVFLPAGSTVNITVKVILPSISPFIERDNITVTIRSQNNTSVGDYVILYAVVQGSYYWIIGQLPEQSHVYLYAREGANVTFGGTINVPTIVSVPPDQFVWYNIGDMGYTQTGTQWYFLEMCSYKPLMVNFDRAAYIKTGSNTYEWKHGDQLHNMPITKLSTNYYLPFGGSGSGDDRVVMYAHELTQVTVRALSNSGVVRTKTVLVAGLYVSDYLRYWFTNFDLVGYSLKLTADKPIAAAIFDELGWWPDVWKSGYFYSGATYTELYNEYMHVHSDPGSEYQTFYTPTASTFEYYDFSGNLVNTDTYSMEASRYIRYSDLGYSGSPNPFLVHVNTSNPYADISMSPTAWFINNISAFMGWNSSMGTLDIYTNEDTHIWIYNGRDYTLLTEFDMIGNSIYRENLATIGFQVDFPFLAVVVSEVPIYQAIRVPYFVRPYPAELAPPVVVTPPLPPTLYIKASQDGKDAILYWDPPPIPGIDHYLIYRSTSQTYFDFNIVWKNTSIDMEPDESVPIPLRTMWNDTNAAFPSNGTNYEQQYYYIIRAVNVLGEVSSTSRTVGKWTKIFPPGVSTFSLPLEPFDILYTDCYTSSMNAEYIKSMNTTSHTWTRHNLGDGNTNNTEMKLGEGFEVKFNNQTNHTFCGMPGAMISYDDDSGFLGFDFNSEARNLTVSIEPGGNVTLNWEEPSSMGVGDWYEVYYSNKRDGFFKTLGVNYSFVCPPVYFGNNTATHEGAKANDPGARLYYMVVPFNAMGIRGASTYSIGIWTEEYLLEYDTIGIPLKLSSNHTADWYCDNIPDTVGINYYMIGQQRWSWHSTRMPSGAYDPFLVMTEGYQISTSQATKFTFIGV